MMLLSVSLRRRQLSSLLPRLSYAAARMEHTIRFLWASLTQSASGNYGNRAKAALRLSPHPLVGREREAGHKHVEPGARRRRPAPRGGVRAAPLAPAVPASIATPASTCVRRHSQDIKIGGEKTFICVRQEDACAPASSLRVRRLLSMLEQATTGV